MAELLRQSFNKRALFPSGKQRQFLLKAAKNLNLAWLLFARKFGVNLRTLNDWKREEYSMPFNMVREISKVAKIKIPENVEIKDHYWYVYKGSKKGSKLGAIACIKKYGYVGGDPEYRKKKWYEWWKKKEKYSNNFIFKRKPIKKPNKSNDLAEFIGIMLGDGGITLSQVQISLNNRNEKEYVEFVRALIKKLFRLNSSIYKSKTSNGLRIQVSSKELIDYLLKLGLNQGRGIKPRDIPQWISGNSKYQTACLRGLMDTGGCVYNHTYKVNRKSYTYKKLCFRNRSQPLLKSVEKILINFNFSPKITMGQCVSLYNSNEVKRYFNEITTHNLKNLKRFRS